MLDVLGEWKKGDFQDRTKKGNNRQLGFANTDGSSRPMHPLYVTAPKEKGSFKKCCRNSGHLDVFFESLAGNTSGTCGDSIRTKE
jgi:hypothetical protein